MDADSQQMEQENVTLMRWFESFLSVVIAVCLEHHPHRKVTAHRLHMNRRAEIGTVVAVRATDGGLGVDEGGEEEREEEEDCGTESHSLMVSLRRCGSM